MLSKTKAKISFATIVLASCLISPTLGHGRLDGPGVIGGSDVRFADRGPCGLSSAEAVAAAKSATALSVKPGEVVLMTWNIVAGDGAGPLTAKMSSSIESTDFNIPVQIAKNIQGNKGILASGQKTGLADFTFKVPNVNGSVLMEVTTPTNFVSCALLNVEGGAKSNAGSKKSPKDGKVKEPKKDAKGKCGDVKEPKKEAKAGGNKKGAEKKQKGNRPAGFERIDISKMIATANLDSSTTAITAASSICNDSLDAKTAQKNHDIAEEAELNFFNPAIAAAKSSEEKDTIQCQKLLNKVLKNQCTVIAAKAKNEVDKFNEHVPKVTSNAKKAEETCGRAKKSFII